MLAHLDFLFALLDIRVCPKFRWDGSLLHLISFHCGLSFLNQIVDMSVICAKSELVN